MRISYRRIPILALGKSIYCDTRLILAKLDAAFPDSELAAASPEQEAIRKLLESWTIDGGIFARAAQSLPPELPIMKDATFTKDREAYTGRSWSPESVSALRPEALLHIRAAFDGLENGLLADGRAWILNTAEPGLADIDAIWPLHWLIGLKVALPPDLVSSRTHPRVFAWCDRFDAAIKKAKASMPKPVTMKGDEAISFIRSAPLPHVEFGADPVFEADPTGLKPGMMVESWPTDTGFRNKDYGKLVKLNKHECVIENEMGLRIHHPRWNFRVRRVEGGSEAKL